MTNFEKIKQMSVEELAVFLSNPYCRPNRKECTNSRVDCKECLKQWLEQEAEDD